MTGAQVKTCSLCGWEDCTDCENGRDPGGAIGALELIPLNFRATLERKGKRGIALFRQLPHDEAIIVGSKVHWGSGARWTVVEVTPQP